MAKRSRDLTPFAERLRDLRAKAELSTRDLDRIAGLSAGHTYLLEGGQGRENKRVSAEVALAVAHVFGVRIEWLINGEGDAPSARHVRLAVARASETPRPRTGTEG